MSNNLKKLIRLIIIAIVITVSAINILADEEWELASVIGRGAIYELDLSPDDSMLAVATTVGVWVYDSQTFEVLHFFDGHIESRDKIDWSPDSQLLAIGSDEGLDIWNLETEERVKRFADKSIVSVAWSPDETILAFVFGTTVRFWDIRANQLVQDLDSLVGSLTWSPDGKLMAVSSGEGVNIIDVNSDQQITYFYLSEHDYDSLYSVDWSPDSRKITATSGDGRLRIFDVVANEHLHTVDEQSSSYSNVAWSPDSLKIATGNGRVTYIYDTESFELITTLEDDLPGIANARYYVDAIDSAHVTWSSDGKTLYTAGWKGYILAWDTETNELLRHTGDHFRFISRMAWSPNHTILATDSPDSSVRLWNGETGEHLASFYGHEDSIVSLAWSPDGTQIATGASDDRFSTDPPRQRSESYRRTVQIWNGETGETLFALEGHSFSVNNVIWSPNGKFLASSDYGTIRIWDTINGKGLHIFELEEQFPIDIVWLQDNRTIAIANQKSVWLLDIEIGTAKQQLVAEGLEFQYFLWSEDGQLFVSGNDRYDPVTEIWDVFNKELVATYDSISDTDLTSSEITYVPTTNQWVATSKFQFPKNFQAVCCDLRFFSFSFNESLFATRRRDIIQIWRRVNN